MTSFPHNLVLDTQPRFGLTQANILKLYNFLINWRILMKIVAKYLGLFQKKIPGGGEDGMRYIFLWVVGAHIFQITWVLGV